MENNSSRNENLFPLILISALRGLAFGLVGGVLAGAIGSMIYWIPTKYSYHQLYANLAISDVIGADILLVGIPLGLMIGVGTGLHAGIFRNHTPGLLAWLSLTMISTVFAVWLSGYSVNVNNPAFFFLKLAFISLATGWLTHRVTMQKYQSRSSKVLVTALCLTSGSLLTLLTVYGYFRSWVYLQNIPS